MNETTTTYGRRIRGCKETKVRTGTWFASVLDFDPKEGRHDGFTCIDIHAANSNAGPAEVTVKDFSKESSPFIVIEAGGSCAVSMYLNPEQAKTLAVELCKATGTTWLPGATW
jgi:hypothetical protein